MVIAGEKKKNIVLVLVSTLLSLAVFLLVIEAFLDFKYERWKSNYANDGDWYGGLTTVSKNPILMWEYRPNAESNYPKYPKIRTNRYGFRDYDYGSMSKPEDIFRISFIGDSVTLGLKVDSQSTFVNKFATYTAEKHPALKIQSLNHGIDGYNAIQIYELLSSKVLQFKPDKIVYVMSLNDFDFEKSAAGKIRYFKKPNSFVLKELEELYRTLLRIDFHLWHFKKNRQKVFDTIVAMKRLLHAQNVDFHVALLPVFEFRGSDQSFADYPLSEMHSAIGQMLKEKQINFIDLLECFRNQVKTPNYFAYDIWHPNEEGHDFIAKQLLHFLTRNM
jgi:lysophospholipase L1-like esterase